jgi:hypothetical protein
MDNNELIRIDFDLNKIVDDWHPFKRDIQFQVLENGNYVISYRNISDNLTDLIVLDADFNLLEMFDLGKRDEPLRLFKYRNFIIISYQTGWRLNYSKLVLLDLAELKPKTMCYSRTVEFKTSFLNETIYVTCNEEHIFCLEEKFPKIHVISWDSLKEITNYSTNSQENLPYCIPIGSKIDQLEFVDNKFIFKYKDKHGERIRIFENGKLIKNLAVTGQSLSINHGKNQIVLWDQEKNKLTYLDSNGQLLSENGGIILENSSTSKLRLYFKKSNNPIFVDLEHAFFYKIVGDNINV